MGLIFWTGDIQISETITFVPVAFMSIITVTTPFNIDLEFRIAAFHKRLLAWFIDLLIIGSFVYLIMRFLLPHTGIDNYEYSNLLYMLIMLPAYTYHLVLEILLNGQTPGKMALKLKVIDKVGKAPSISQYFLRWIFRIIDISFTAGGAAILSIALSKFNQRIGDIVAGTVVIDNASQTGLNQTIYLDITTAENVVFPEVMRLTDRDINGIRNLLAERTGNRDNEHYKIQVAERIKEVLNVTSELEPDDFLSQLLRDYNVITGK